MAGSDQLAQRRRRSDAPLAVLVEHDLPHRVARVEPDEVEQLERPHRVVGAALHRDVDLLDRAEALLVGADRVEQVRDQQAVDDEARLVLRVHDGLLQALAPLETGLERASFEEVIDSTTSSSGITCAGLKKWRPMKCSGRFVTAAWFTTESDDVLVANSASVLDDPVQLLPHLELRVEVLGDRLDHEVAARRSPCSRASA